MSNVVQFRKPDDGFEELQRFPFIWDHSVIPYERKTPQIPVLAHVLVGEPDPTSPGHALEFEHRSTAVSAVLPMPWQVSATGFLYAKAKEDVRSLILMFDVALMHGRLAILKMDHPETRPRLEAHLRAIEEMLDLARVKAARL